MSKSQLHIHAIQMKVEPGVPDVNFARVAQRMEESMQAEQRPDVIVLPEMWNTGFALDRIGEQADSTGERTKYVMSAFSKKHQVNVIAGSVAVIEDSKIQNTAFVFNRSGECIMDYSKIHLFRLMEEEKYLQGGNKLGLFELDGVQAGIIICYDTRFPELSRQLALSGAKLMFVPAQWPHPRLHHWRTLLMARALRIR